MPREVLFFNSSGGPFAFLDFELFRGLGLGFWHFPLLRVEIFDKLSFSWAGKGESNGPFSLRQTVRTPTKFFWYRDSLELDGKSR